MGNTSYIIEKRLILMRGQNLPERLLSKLEKGYSYISRQFEPFAYSAGSEVYAYAPQNCNFTIGCELLEHGQYKAMSTHADLLKILGKRYCDDAPLKIHELAFDDDLRYGEDDLMPQIEQLWSAMEYFFKDKKLLEALKAAFSDNASILDPRRREVNSVERLRTVNTCSYFNRTVQLLLIYLLEDRWRPADTFLFHRKHPDETPPTYSFDDELARSYGLPPEFSVLACGRPAHQDIYFPEYPTDMWLVRREVESGRVLGVYAVELEGFSDRLRDNTLEELFPEEEYISILDKFYEHYFSSADFTVDKFDNYYFCSEDFVDKQFFVTSFLNYEAAYLAAKEREVAAKEREEQEALIKAYTEERFAILASGDWESVDLHELDLSERSYNFLEKANVHTAADLLALSYEDLFKVGIGGLSALEICDKVLEVWGSKRNGK